MGRVVIEEGECVMGQRVSAFLCILLLFAVSSVNATIVDWSCTNDSANFVISSPPVWTQDGITIDGSQSGKPAILSGSITTDTEGFDPTVGIIEDVQNDTSFAWTDYHIAIGMNKTFSILNTGLMTPDGWYSVITAVAPGITPTGGNGWVGTVDYYQGTGDPVAIGDDGLFGFKVSFTGSTLYCTGQNPTPEPTMIILLGLGAIAVIKRRRV